jgi:hypothetical protein
VISSDDARRVVEHLRSGIPSRVVAQHFPMGRENLLRRIEADLEAIEAGDAEAVHLRFLRAQYGDGKSHALHAIWNVAARRHWLVSWAVISRETPFDKLPTVYRKLMENTYLPEAAQPGFRRLLDQLKPGGPQATEVLEYARSQLHDKIATILENVFEGIHAEALDDLHRDLAGDFLSVPDVKAVHRRNFGRPVRMSPFRQQVDTFDYMRLVDFLSRTRGLGGWLILLDEMELVAKLGSKARARAYANLMRLRAGALPHTYVICAIADNYYNEVLVRESERLPNWLRERNEADLAEASVQALQAISADPLRLEPLSAADLQAVMRHLVVHHAQAYGWSPPMDGEAMLERVRAIIPRRDAPLRTLLRTAIYWLDITWQYGREPTLQVGRPEEEGLAEAAAADEPEWASDGDADGTVRRQKLF